MDLRHTREEVGPVLRTLRLRFFALNLKFLFYISLPCLRQQTRRTFRSLGSRSHGRWNMSSCWHHQAQTDTSFSFDCQLTRVQTLH